MKAPYFHFIGVTSTLEKESFIKKLEELGYSNSHFGLSEPDEECVGVAIFCSMEEKNYTLCWQGMDTNNPRTSWTLCRERFSARDTFFNYLKDFEKFVGYEKDNH